MTKYKLMARLRVHGNKDADRELFRADAAVVSHMGFRMLYSVAHEYGMVPAKADIRGAYTQLGEAKREVLVNPPCRVGTEQCLWLLKASVYGLAVGGVCCKLRAADTAENDYRWSQVANGIVRDVVRREVQISYLQPTIRERKEPWIVCFAGFPHPGENKKVAQEGCVFVVSFGTEKGSKFHTLGWLSRK